MRLWITIVVLLLVASLSIAQPQPQKVQWIVPGRYQIRDMYAIPQVFTGPQSLFLLNRGTLARLDPDTLQETGTVEIFGQLTDLSQETDPQTMWSTIANRAQRLQPATMSLQGDNLNILIGDQFAHVSTTTMTMKVNKSLENPELNQNMMFQVDAHILGQQGPVVATTGSLLYNVENPNPLFGDGQYIITAIDTNTGERQQKPLPPALAPSRTSLSVPGLPATQYVNVAMGPGTICLATPQAVYVLRLGALAKLDPKTLEPIKVAELLGPLAPVNEYDLDEVKAAAVLDRAERSMPSVMYKREKDLLIVVGDRFFRVDSETLAINKQSMLVPTKPAQRKQRFEQLAACGQIQGILQTKRLLIARGKEVLAINPEDGTATQVALPEELTRPLRLVRPAVAKYTPAPLAEGTMVNIGGPVWKEKLPDGEAWVLYSEQYGGEIVLTGNLDKVTEMNGPLVATSLNGIFKKERAGVPKYGLGSVEVDGNPNSTLVFTQMIASGTARKVILPEGEFWVLKTQIFGTDYLLTGDKVKELAAVPDVTDRPVTIMGSFTRHAAKMPDYGKGIITIDTFLTAPSQQETFDKADASRAATIVANTDSLYVLRNGWLARFAADTLALQAKQDLLPPMPALTEKITEEQMQAIGKNVALRQAASTLLLSDKDVLFLHPNLGFFRLNGDTLAVTAKSQGELPVALYPGYCCLVGEKVVAVSNAKVMALKMADGTIAATANLPPLLTRRIFPDPVAAAK